MAGEVIASRSRGLADGHADTFPQPPQGKVDGGCLRDMIRTQHVPHLTLGDIEATGETTYDMPALRNAS